MGNNVRRKRWVNRVTERDRKRAKWYGGYGIRIQEIRDLLESLCVYDMHDYSGLNADSRKWDDTIVFLCPQIDKTFFNEAVVPAVYTQLMSQHPHSRLSVNIHLRDAKSHDGVLQITWQPDYLGAPGREHFWKGYNKPEYKGY